jgi:hypothetical protein
MTLLISVADPRSRVFGHLDPGSGINIPNHIYEILVIITTMVHIL